MNTRPELTRYRRFYSRAFAVAAMMGAAMVLISPVTRAQTAISWSRTTNGTWSTGTNWTGGALPANSVNTNFASFNNATGVTVTTDTTQSVAGIDFGSTAGAYTLSRTGGAAVTLTLGAYGIKNASANNQILTGSLLRLTLGAASGFQVNSTGNLSISSTGGTIATTGTNTLTLSGSSTGVGTVSSIISGAGSVTKSGTGTWILSGVNTFTGTTNVNAGTLRATTSTSALGAGSLSLGGGTLELADNTGLNFARNTTVTSNSTIKSDRVSAGAGVTQTLGTLSIGAQTLTVNAGSNATSGTAGITFGATTLTGAAVFNTGASASLSLGLTSESGGAQSFTKQGAGSVVFTGVNTFTGGTTLTAGTLTVNSGAALSGATGALTVNGGTLNLNNTAQTVAAFNGSGGTVNLASGHTLTVNTATTDSYSGVVTGAGGLTKIGIGSLTLSGVNSGLSGFVIVTAGTLNLGSDTAVGTNALALNGGTIAATGGSRTLSNVPAIVASSTIGGSNDLTFNSTMINAMVGNPTVTIDNSGTTSFAGLTLSNTTTSRTMTIAGTGNTIITGAVDQGTSTVSALTKSGTGTLTLAGANTYDGLTTASGGTLTLSGNNSAAAGGITVSAGTLNLNHASAAGTGTLAINGGTIDNTSGAAITLGTNNSQTWGGNFTFTGTNNLNLGTGAVTLSANRTVTTTAGNLTVGGAISDGASSYGITKAGAGTLILTGSNAYDGGTTVNAGVLNAGHNNALGTGNILVAAGATLQLQGTNLSVGGGSSTLTLAGTGTGTSGNTAALLNVGGSTTRVNNNLALNADATVSSGTTSGATLILGGAPPAAVPGVSAPDTHVFTLGANKLTLAGASSTTLQVDANISGTGGVDVNTGGTVIYNANKNTYTGTTNVVAGTLIVDTANNPFAPHDATSTSFYGINGPLVIGDGSGAAGSAVVQLGVGAASTNEAIKSTSAVTIYSDGALNLNGNAQNIGKLVMSGGTIDGSTGGLYLDFANTSVDITPTATSGTATINGLLSLTYHKDAATEGALPNQTRTFNVGHDSANVSDLTINALVSQGSLIKTGAGTMTLATSNNSYLGTTTVNNGILNVRVGTEYVSGSFKSSLGAGDNDGSLGENTIVNNGGTLQMQGGIAITNEQLTLLGNGYAGNQGALENLSGNNTWGAVGTGGIALGADARIGSTAGLLTVASSITSTSGNFGLTIGGAGNTTISGGVNTGTGGSTTLTKTGTGTLILSGNNGYQGATAVQQGVVSVQNNGGLGSALAGTTVSNGAELQLSNAANGNLSIGAEALSLTGAGVGGTSGALHNVAGTNSFAGLVTLAADSTIKASAGTLTLSGGTSSANYALTVAGAGNTTISGTMSHGTGIVNKNDAGTFTFSGATGTVGAVHLNTGGMSVGGSSTLNTAALNSAVGTTLTIATGGSLAANYASGTTFFSGAMTGGGTFEKDGAGTLVFDHSFSATNLTLILNGGTLSLASAAQITVGTIRVTGNTILDFNNSAGTFLSSTNLIIDAGVTVTVNNWTSIANNAALSTVWYATSTVNGGTLGGVNQVGGTPLTQIAFPSYTGLTTTWVANTTNGWFTQEIRPTPEPATYGAILISGSLALLGWRRFGRKRAGLVK